MPRKLRLRIPRFRFRFRTALPALTPSERLALIVLASLLGTGACLHAWERAGVSFGPVDDTDALREMVTRARTDQGDPEFPCDAKPAPRARSAGSDADTEKSGSPTTTGDTPPASAPAPVNVNTADEKVLVTLPGIGPVTARAILEHRDARGPFARTEDLQNVRGIGPRKLEALRGRITVAPAPASPSSPPDSAP